jgi:integrase
MLEHAVRARRITTNPVRQVRKAPLPRRHSFASLLLYEGRSVIYVARQLGHDARLTLTRYGHVIDALEDEPRMPAEEAIRVAREEACTRLVPASVIRASA